METADPALKPEQQAVQEMHVEPYASFNNYGNYLHISVVSNRVVVGDTLSVQAHIKCDLPERKRLVEHLTYAVSLSLWMFWHENVWNVSINYTNDGFCRY